MFDNVFNHYNHIATTVVVLVPDADGLPRVAFINNAAQKSMLRTPEEVLGKPFSDIFPGRVGQTAVARHTAALTSGQPSTYETEIPIQDGSRWFRTTLSQVPDANGKVHHLVATSIDITDHRAAQELTTQMQAKQTEMEQFVSLAAHDLRTPLRHIRMTAAELREDFVDMGDGKMDLIDDLESIALKATILITDVLKVSQSRTKETKPQTFDLSRLCENIAAVLDPTGIHRITWPPCTLHTDKTALQILLRNLVDNALKHGGKARMNVAITLAPSTPDDGLIELHVTDDGRGFSDAENVFANDGICRSNSGFGLLAVRNLVLGRKGRIWVNTGETTGGSTVCFQLPGQTVSGDIAPRMPQATEQLDIAS